MKIQVKLTHNLDGQSLHLKGLLPITNSPYPHAGKAKIEFQKPNIYTYHRYQKDDECTLKNCC
jgi:hypothetical protein